MHIGHKIQEIIVQRDIGAVEFADKIFCSRKHIYKIFGKPNINTELLTRISLALDFDFYEWISGELSSEFKRQDSIHVGDSLLNGDNN